MMIMMIMITLSIMTIMMTSIQWIMLKNLGLLPILYSALESPIQQLFQLCYILNFTTFRY